MDAYDVLIVGSGTGGQTAAYDLRERGLTVAVVEQSERPGGTCALYGCQPKKFFYEAAETVARSRHLMGKGIQVEARGSWSEVREAKNRFTDKIPEGTRKGFREEGIDFLSGRARFLDGDTLVIDGKPVRPKYTILATGARPMPLPIQGEEHIISSDAYLDLENLPPRIVFIGGGFISFEFAHFAARLGPKNNRITILEVADRPLGPFDAEMVDLLVAASKDDGIDIHSGVRISSIEKTIAGFTVATDTGSSFEADLVVHGAGRVPIMEDLNLDAADIRYTRRGISVDSGMRTSNPRVFAVGDCAATLQLARVADYEAMIAARNILAERGHTDAAQIEYGAVAMVLFTYPQYAMVGKTEVELKEAGTDYRKSFGKHLGWPTYGRIGLKHAAYKILTARDGHILGAHILSDNASGMINTIRMAIIQGTTASELWQQSVMSPYPTRESDLLYMLEPLTE